MAKKEKDSLAALATECYTAEDNATDNPIESKEYVFVNYTVPTRSPNVEKRRKVEDTIKFVFFLFNLIFTVKCMVSVGLCIWLKTNAINQSMLTLIAYDGSDITPPYNYHMTIFLTWVAAIGIIVGLFSCRFSIVHKKKQLKMYVVAMTGIFFGELLVGILAILSRNLVHTIPVDKFKVSLNESIYTKSSIIRNKWDIIQRQVHTIPLDKFKVSLNVSIYTKSSIIRNKWDIIQRQLECCGVNGYTDFDLIFNNSTMKVPESCCVSGDSNYAASMGQESCRRTVGTTAHSLLIYKEGCYEKLIWYCKVFLGKLCAVSCGFSTVQWIGMAIGMVLIQLDFEYHTYI